MGLRIEVIHPDGVLFTGIADMITAPGKHGEFGALEGHIPFMTALAPGIVTIENGAERTKIALQEGIAQITPHSCTILSSTAELVREAA